MKRKNLRQVRSSDIEVNISVGELTFSGSVLPYPELGLLAKGCEINKT
jgi:hypothetical protein